MSRFMATIEIRRAARGDVPALGRLAAAFDAEVQGPVGLVEAAAIGALLDEPSWGSVLVADGDGVVLGYALVDYGFDRQAGGRDATLRELFVDRDARGCGLGKALVEAAAGAARGHGARVLRAVVRTDDARARRLCERRGFEPDGRLRLARPVEPR